MISLGITPISEYDTSNFFNLLGTICSDCNTIDCYHAVTQTDSAFVNLISEENESLNHEAESDSISTQILEGHGNFTQASIKTVQSNSANHYDSPISTKPVNSQSNSSNNCAFEFKRRGTHIANLNIRHLKPKVDNMKILLNQANSIDIFGLCETFLNETVDNDQVHINGFKFERKDRPNTVAHPSGKGGGILIYIAEHIDYSRHKEIESSDIESVWIEVHIKNSKSFLVCSVYRPPSSNIEWCESFSKEIEKALTLNDEIYIMGDINYDCKDGIYSNATWKNTVELHDLQQVIQSATRITAHSETTIDHLYVSNTDKLSDISVPYISLSDHYPIGFTRTTSKNTIKRHEYQTIRYRCYKKFNEDDFLKELANSLNALSISQTESNKNFDNLSKIILNILNKHAPFKSKRVKREKQPDWINEEIKEACRKKDMNHKLKNWNQYKFWRNKRNSHIRNAKKISFQNQSQKIKKIRTYGNISETLVARHLPRGFLMNL